MKNTFTVWKSIKTKVLYFASYRVIFTLFKEEEVTKQDLSTPNLESVTKWHYL